MSQEEGSLTKQDLEKQLEALDGSGVALRAKVLEQLKKDNWRVEKDVSVSAAPFLYDSVKPDETMRPENDAGQGAKSPGGIVRIQNEHLRRAASVDIVATSSSTNVLCVGIEKRDPRRENWVFADPDVADEGLAGASIKNKMFFAVSKKSSSTQESGDLLHVPEDDGAASGWAVRMEEVELLLETYRYDQGLSFRKDEGGYAPDGSLADASGRLVEGTFGLIVESLIQEILSSGDRDEKFTPIIVTTANILVCEYKDKLTVGGMPKDAVVYNCPVPLRARFPGHIAGWNGRKYRSGRWPVLIVTPKGLSDLLPRL